MLTSKRVSVLLIWSIALVLWAPVAEAQLAKKGVNLFYLDGIDQGLWTIADGVNSNDPATIGKLRSGLALLQASGVNTIRLLIGARDHYSPRTDALAVALINNLLTFIDGATTPANAFTYEIIIVTDINAPNAPNPFYHRDSYPFTSHIYQRLGL